MSKIDKRSKAIELGKLGGKVALTPAYAAATATVGAGLGGLAPVASALLGPCCAAVGLGHVFNSDKTEADSEEMKMTGIGTGICAAAIAIPATIAMGTNYEWWQVSTALGGVAGAAVGLCQSVAAIRDKYEEIFGTEETIIPDSVLPSADGPL